MNYNYGSALLSLFETTSVKTPDIVFLILTPHKTSCVFNSAIRKEAQAVQDKIQFLNVTIIRQALTISRQTSPY